MTQGRNILGVSVTAGASVGFYALYCTSSFFCYRGRIIMLVGGRQFVNNFRVGIAAYAACISADAGICLRRLLRYGGGIKVSCSRNRPRFLVAAYMAGTGIRT